MPKRRKKITMAKVKECYKALGKLEKDNVAMGNAIWKGRNRARKLTGRLIIQQKLLPRIKWTIQPPRTDFINFSLRRVAVTLVAAKKQPDLAAVGKLNKLIWGSKYTPVLWQDPKSEHIAITMGSRPPKIYINFPNQERALDFISKHKLEVRVTGLRRATKLLKKEVEKLTDLADDFERK